MPEHRESPIKRVNPSGKVRWIARYTGPDGKRRSAGTFRLEREAQAAIDQAYARPPVRDTVGQYAASWTDRYPRSARTNHTNNGRIAQVLEVPIEGRALRDWPFAELRRRHALELADHMLRVQGRAASGAVNILRTLSAMAEDAITDEICGSNAFRGAKVRASDPRALKASRKARVLSWDQMHRLAASSGSYEPMFRTISDCGLRIGEVFALRRSNVQANVLSVAGSAWEGQLIETSREKNHSRQIPIPPSLQVLLRDMPTRIDTDLLFPTPTGRMWRINNFYRAIWNPARKLSGVDATPHDFRHSWCSLLRAEGIDPADLASMAGHSVETATARYTHPLRQSFDQVREAIG